jgi:hypothetical protein
MHDVGGGRSVPEAMRAALHTHIHTGSLLALN